MMRLTRRFLLLSVFIFLFLLLFYTFTGHTPSHNHPTHQFIPPDFHYAQNGRSLLAKNFPFSHSFSFPQPRIMRQLIEIDSSKFLHNLRQFLLQYTSDRPLALITSNSKYADVLLNWLISATVRSGIPLDTIIVFSLDTRIHALLTKRQIPSILVTPADLFRPDVTFDKMFDEIMMLRLALMRIVSHFGFDVVMYDTDAIMLRDPQPVYDHFHSDDIIGSVGRIPYDLLAEWGITICIGMVLIRSSTKTEQYWESMQDICLDSVDDQTKLNCGLKALNIHWANSNDSHKNTTVHGVTSNQLHVSILPHNIVCRKEWCEPMKRAEYYIWHKGGHRSRKEKLAGAREGRTWFLKYQWQLIRNDLTGVRWLESICYSGVTHE